MSRPVGRLATSEGRPVGGWLQSHRRAVGTTCLGRAAAPGARKAGRRVRFAAYAYPTCGARSAAGTGLFGVAAVARGPSQARPPHPGRPPPRSANERPRESSESRSSPQPGLHASATGRPGRGSEPDPYVFADQRRIRRAAPRLRPLKQIQHVAAPMPRDLSAFVGQDHGGRLVVEWFAAAVADVVIGGHALVIGINGFALQCRAARLRDRTLRKREERAGARGPSDIPGRQTRSLNSASIPSG
jgi:hypothetical protein